MLLETRGDYQFADSLNANLQTLTEAVEKLTTEMSRAEEKKTDTAASAFAQQKVEFPLGDDFAITIERTESPVTQVSVCLKFPNGTEKELVSAGKCGQAGHPSVQEIRVYKADKDGNMYDPPETVPVEHWEEYL